MDIKSIRIRRKTKRERVISNIFFCIIALLMVVFAQKPTLISKIIANKLDKRNN
jgi:hypothetical protein